MDAALGRTWVHNMQKGSNAASRSKGVTDAWLMNLEVCALSAFQWEGVPEEIDPHFIEWCLLHYGWGGMFDMSDSNRDGYLAFSVGAFEGKWNMYFNPLHVRYMDFNGTGSWFRSVTNSLKTYAEGGILRKPDSVMLWDNIARRPMLQILDWYAKRLAQCDMVIDQNVAAQACPYIVACDEEQQKAAMNEYMAVSTFTPVIIKKKLANPATDIEVLQTGAPYMANDILDTQARILNQAYTLIGVDNSFSSKKERLITAEVNGNNEQVLMFRASRLKMREDFCRAANAVFGTDMSVRYAVEKDERGSAWLDSDGSERDGSTGAAPATASEPRRNPDGTFAEGESKTNEREWVINR